MDGPLTRVARFPSFDSVHPTGPGIWVILAAVLALLVGFFVWMSVGTIETTVEIGVSAQNHVAEVAW